MENKTIYLDNCTYNRPFDDQSQLRISLETQAKLYIQSLIRDNKIDLVYSYVCFYENFINPFEDKKLSISNFSEYAKYSVIENHDILVKANEIIHKRIKPLDALHLSCAINADVDYFITVDDGILRYNTNEIKIPAAERRRIFVLPENCTAGLIPSVTPQSGGVLNPTARIKIFDPPMFIKFLDSQEGEID